MTLQEIFSLSQVVLCCTWLFCLLKLYKTSTDLIDGVFKNELEILTIRADMHYFEHMKEQVKTLNKEVRELKERLVKFD